LNTYVAVDGKMNYEYFTFSGQKRFLKDGTGIEKSIGKDLIRSNSN
jgi:hypothetical protein